MTILDVYNYALWLLSVITDNYRYFEDRITQTWNGLLGKLDKLGEFIGKKFGEAVDYARDYAKSLFDKLYDWAAQKVDYLLDRIIGMGNKVLEYAEKKYLQLRAELIDYAYSLYKQAAQLVKDAFGDVMIEVNWVRQIGKDWGYDFQALGSYLGYLGSWLTRQRVDRLVQFDLQGLDYVVKFVANPVAWFSALLRANLLAILTFLLAEAFRGDNDPQPVWTFPKWDG